MPGHTSATSVVVSTYDEKRWDDLAACMRSLAEQSRPPLETILVVDHNPALLERAKREFSGARVIANDRLRGLAGARNSGIAAARGEIVAFIDDDARAEPQWLDELEGCIADATTVGAGGALLPLWQGPAPGWFPKEFYWVFGCSYTGLPEGLAPVRNPIGANMAVRASVLTEVGGFREGQSDDAPREIRSRGVVRAGGNVPDDTDLAIRVKQRRPDAVWLYQPRARVLHTVTPERASLGYFLRRCYEEGAGKANLSRYVGASDGLSSERRHLAVVLPRGAMRGLRDLGSGDGGGALRAGAIVIGVLSSAAGFLVATLAGALKRDSTKE
jgi:glycosyltransferase involved in cell wall biosynthesis